MTDGRVTSISHPALIAQVDVPVTCSSFASYTGLSRSGSMNRVGSASTNDADGSSAFAPGSVCRPLVRPAGVSSGQRTRAGPDHSQRRGCVTPPDYLDILALQGDRRAGKLFEFISEARREVTEHRK